MDGASSPDAKMSSSEDEIANHQPIEDNNEGIESEDESNDASSESSEDSQDRNGFLDIMAAEGSQDEDSEAGSENQFDDESEEGFSSYRFHTKFPQFMNLPFELRRRIWELYCPELRLKPRVLDFTLNCGTARHRDLAWASTTQVWTVQDGIMLGDMTLATRRVLSVHSESRRMALAVLTDTLALDAGSSGNAVVRFNPEKDVVKVSGLLSRDFRTGDSFHLKDFAEKVKNLAVGSQEVFNIDVEDAFCSLLDEFSNLETIFLDAPYSDVPTDESKQKRQLLGWCASDLIYHHFIETTRKSYSVGEDNDYIFCWPDMLNHKDFAKVSVNKLWCEEEFIPGTFFDYLSQRKLEPWPLVWFDGIRGWRRYEWLLDPEFHPGRWQDSDPDTSYTERSDSDVDEYESDGIDDAEVPMTFDDSDDGNLSNYDRHLEKEDDEEVIEARFSSPEVGSGSDREPSTVNRTRNRRVVSDSDDEEEEEEEVIEAHFSSPEAESGPDGGPSTVNRGKKRRIVSDSEDEEGDEEPASKRARTARVVLSDSEEEPILTQGSSRGRGRPRAVLSDSEDDEEGGADITHPAPKKDAGSGEEHESSSEDSEERSDSDSDDSEDDDEDEQPAKQLSLAERLRMHRDANPVPDDEDNSSGTADQDDEDEDEDDEDEENGYLHRMAEDESGSEDGGEEYDYEDG